MSLDPLVDPYIKTLFGCQARKAAFNYVLQPDGAGNGAVIGITSLADVLAFGGKRTHTLVICDVVIRPHLVIESDHLAGAGASGILKGGMADVDAWLQHGHVLIDNIPKPEFYAPK